MPYSPAALSPRRRALLAGVLALALAAVAMAGLALARGPLDDAGGDRPYPPQDRTGPVLLVPGYGGGTGGLERLAARIRATGRSATVLSSPGDGTGDLGAQADAVAKAVDEALRGGAPSVDLVGYSAGGVVLRLWAAEHDGEHKARRIVTLGAPHHGARLAAIGAAFAPADCPRACQQLVPGSALLTGLDRTPVAARPAWLSLWTTADEVVTPPETSRLAGAVNVALQSVCPGEAVRHGGLPTSPLVGGLVLRAIGTAPLTPPTAADCARLGG